MRYIIFSVLLLATAASCAQIGLQHKHHGKMNATLAKLEASCNSHKHCRECVSEEKWSGPCRWCDEANGGDGSCHAPGSILFNPCKRSQNIVDIEQCHAEEVIPMKDCPLELDLSDESNLPEGWVMYRGDSSIFHCGFKSMLEDRMPSHISPINECVYDEDNKLVTEDHKYCDCRGTPDENVATTISQKINHLVADLGGIKYKGYFAGVESKRYALDHDDHDTADTISMILHLFPDSWRRHSQEASCHYSNIID